MELRRRLDTIMVSEPELFHDVGYASSFLGGAAPPASIFIGELLFPCASGSK